MKKVILNMFCLVILLQIANGAIVKGTVRDAATGRAIPAANVYLKEIRTIGASADIEGNFVIKRIPEGKYTVVASNVGYKPKEEQVEISFESEKELQFSLDETATLETAVVVTATKEPRILKEVPIRTEIITPKQINEKCAVNLYDVLEGEPGIRVEQQCSNCNFTMLRIAGLDGGYAQMLIDGQPIFSGLAGVFGMQQLQSSNIQQIEIVKGAGSALYGSDALGGIVNIIMKEPASIPTMTVNALAGTHGKYSYGFEGTMRKNKVGIAYSFQQDLEDDIDESGNINENFVEEGNFDDAGEDGFTDRVFSRNTSGGINLHVYEPWGVGSKVKAFIRAMGEFRKGGFIENYDDPFDLDAEHIQTERYESGLGIEQLFDKGQLLTANGAIVSHYRTATNGAAWDKLLENGMAEENDAGNIVLTDQANTYIHENGYNSFHRNYMPKPFISDEMVYIGDLKYSNPILTTGSLTLGAQYKRSELEQDINGDPTKDEKSADDIGFFAQADIYPFSENFELVIGGRFDMHSSFDSKAEEAALENGTKYEEYEESSFNPRIAAKYSLTNDIILRTAFGTGFRVPYLFAEDLHLCASSPKIYKGDDLEAETAQSLSFGVDFNHGNTQISLNSFYTTIDDKVEFIDGEGGDVPEGYDYRWTNVGKATTVGIEFFIAGVPNEWLEYQFTADYTHAKYEELRIDDQSIVGYEKSDYVPRTPAITANLKLNLKPIDKTTLGFAVNYTGSMYIDHIPNEDESLLIIEETDPFVTIDTKISYNLVDKLNIFLHVSNLTDYIQPTRDITDAAYMYAPIYGREISIGLNYSFNPFL